MMMMLSGTSEEDQGEAQEEKEESKKKSSGEEELNREEEEEEVEEEDEESQEAKKKQKRMMTSRPTSDDDDSSIVEFVDDDDVEDDRIQKGKHEEEEDNNDNNNNNTREKQEDERDSSGSATNKQQEEDSQLTNLIVNYLPQSMSQEEIRDLFSSIGEVESCKLIKDKSTINQSLGYGFVNYVTAEDAQRAIKSFNGLRLQNKTIKVSYARPSSESIKGANLYVSGLPKSMTQFELEQLFHPFGKIITSRILCDNLTGISKGVGFVRFDQRFEAERAIESLNNTYIQLQNQTVNVSHQPFSQPAAATSDSSADQDPAATTLNCPATSDNSSEQLIDSNSASQKTTSSSTPIIVKFANSPSSNSQKQMAAAAAAAATAALISTSHKQPTSGLFNSLAAHHQFAAGGPAGVAGSSSSAAAASRSAALSAYMSSQAAIVATCPQVTAQNHSMAQLAAAAVPAAAFPNQAPTRNARNFSSPVSSSLHQQHQQGPIYHYPANRFRYSPLTTSSLVNPFALQQQQQHHLNSLTSDLVASAASTMFPILATSGHHQQQQTKQPTTSFVGAELAGISGRPEAASFLSTQQQAIDHQHRLAAAATGNLTGWCLFVYNLDPEIEENVIWKLFGPFGAVQQVNLVRDSQTNKCKGFAFVTMSDYNEAVMAIQSLNGYTIANRVLQVSFKTSKLKKTNN